MHLDPALAVRELPLCNSEIDLGRARRATGVRDSFERARDREREAERDRGTKASRTPPAFPLLTKSQIQSKPNPITNATAAAQHLPHVPEPLRANLRVYTTLQLPPRVPACIVSRVCGESVSRSARRN